MIKKAIWNNLKHAITFAFAVSAFNAAAQITLDAGDLPALGDIIYTANPTDVNINIGIADTNQIWDFK